MPYNQRAVTNERFCLPKREGKRARADALPAPAHPAYMPVNWAALLTRGLGSGSKCRTDHRRIYGSRAAVLAGSLEFGLTSTPQVVTMSPKIMFPKSLVLPHRR